MISFIVAHALCIVNTAISRNMLDEQVIVPEEYTTMLPLPGDKRFNEVSLLGSHNAAISQAAGWRYYQQGWSLRDQLAAGVRYFEIDLGSDKKNTKLMICHKSCEGKCEGIPCSWQKRDGSYDTLQKVMKIFEEWLVKHPDEIIVWMIDSGRDKYMRANQLDEEIDKNSGFNRFILKPTDWDPAQHNNEWPMINWMRINNKRLVIFNSRPELDSGKYTYHYWRYIAPSNLGITPEACNVRNASVLRRQENNYADPAELSLYQLSHHTDISSELLYMLQKKKDTLLSGPEGWKEYLEKNWKQGVKYTAEEFADTLGSSAKSVKKGIVRGAKKVSRSITSTFDDKKNKIKEKNLDKLLAWDIPMLSSYDNAAKAPYISNYNHYIKDERKVSDNDPHRIQSIEMICNTSEKFPQKHPNFLVFDHTEQFIKKGGLALINRWNGYTVPYASKAEYLLRTKMYQLKNEIQRKKTEIDAKHKKGREHLYWKTFKNEYKMLKRTENALKTLLFNK